MTCVRFKVNLSFLLYASDFFECSFSVTARFFWEYCPLLRNDFMTKGECHKTVNLFPALKLKECCQKKKKERYCLS